MIDPITGAALIAGGTSVLSDLFNVGSTVKTNQLNQKLVKEQWAREDNAVQRRVHDLEAAGLSPVLAAGQGAQTSQAMKLEAPQVKGDAVEEAYEAASKTIGLKKTVADIQATNAQVAYINQQAKGEEIKNRILSETATSKIGLANLNYGFAADTYADRVKTIAKRLEGMNLDIIGKDLDNQLGALKIPKIKLETELIKVRKALGSAQVADTIASTVAKAALLQNYASQRDYLNARTEYTKKMTSKPYVAPAKPSTESLWGSLFGDSSALEKLLGVDIKDFFPSK